MSLQLQIRIRHRAERGARDGMGVFGQHVERDGALLGINRDAVAVLH